MLPKKCIILGSGASILDGLVQRLQVYLEKEITFSINDNIKFFKSTVAMFGDWTVYRDRFDLFKNHPLVIGRYDTHIGNTIEGATPCPKHDGLILLQSSGHYQGNKGLEKGLYSGILTGGFTLSLAIQLGFKEIFLLGFDCCEINGRTHFYQDIPNAGCFKDYEGKPYIGVGKNDNGGYNTSFYDKSDEQINKLWKPFTSELDVQIYNVSPLSKINVFSKIDYRMFFRTIEDGSQINQDEVRKEIRNILQPFNKV